MIKKLKSKSGAIEMSLNLIIMLIIGMVVLGLVIGFVNSLVNRGTETFENQIGEQDQLKLDEVSNCRDNLCILPKPTLTLQKGQQSKMYVKVRNTGTEQVSCSPGPIVSCADTVLRVDLVDSQGVAVPESEYTIVGQGFNLESGGEASRMYVIEAADTLAVGTYFMTISSSIDTTSVVLTLNVE